jgi:MFS family permease
MTRLVLVATAVHGADQLALAATPFVAVLVFGAGPSTVAALVAVQSAAWLLASIPAGLLVDRLDRRTLVLAALAISALGFGGAAAAIEGQSLPAFSVMLLVAGVAVVTLALTLMSLVATSVAPPSLATANARLEAARAGWMLAAPVLASAVA